MNGGELGWARSSEQPFIRKSSDWVEWVVRESNWRRTDFLSPREQKLLDSVARRAGCVVAFDGGGRGAERSRGLVMPSDWMPEPADFGVRLLTASIATGPPTHGSVLGSLLGTGIDRRKVGDIEIQTSSAVIAVCEEISPFVQGHWLQIGRHPVRLDEANRGVFRGPEYAESEVQLTSLRLDALVGACCHWSRTKAKTAVESGDVTLNFAEVVDADEAVAVGDIVSVLRFGRIRVMGEQGESRKGRQRLHVGIVKSNR